MAIGSIAVGTSIAERPPAQIRTGGIPAYGSHLGCLTRKRSDGHGWRILGGGSHSRARLSILSHVVTSFWLRRRSERRQRSTTLKRNALSTRKFVGTAWSLNQPWTTWPSHCPCRDGGSCMRFRRPSLISFSFARMRSPRLLRFKRKPPLRDLPQMKVKPRNLKVSGLLKPRRSRLAAAGSHSPRSRPFAPPAPPPARRFCSQASQLLRPSLTSPVRSSSATAPHRPDAIRRRKRPGWARDLPVPEQRASAHARVSDRAGLSEHSRCRVPPCRLPSGLKRRRPG